MDPSVFGTGSIVLNRGEFGHEHSGQRVQHRARIQRGTFATQNGLGQVEPVNRYLQLNWALPTGGPADFPMVLDYQSNSGVDHRVRRQLVGPPSAVRGRHAAGERCHAEQPAGRLVTYNSPDAERSIMRARRTLSITR